MFDEVKGKDLEISDQEYFKIEITAIKNSKGSINIIPEFTKTIPYMFDLIFTNIKDAVLPVDLNKCKKVTSYDNFLESIEENKRLESLLKVEERYLERKVSKIIIDNPSKEISSHSNLKAEESLNPPALYIPNTMILNSTLRNVGEV